MGNLMKYEEQLVLIGGAKPV